MRSTKLLPLFLGLFAALDHLSAGSPVAFSKDEQAACDTLRSSDQFCGGAVGYAGVVPPQIKALRYLVGAKNGDAAFKQLLSSATTSGKLYALCGLYFTDNAAFKREIEPFRKSNKKVEIFMGCNVAQDSVAALVENNSPAVVRLNGPGDSLKDWLKLHPSLEKSGYLLDILGGGWPERLVHSRNSFE